jgi:hypothetical protein
MGARQEITFDTVRVNMPRDDRFDRWRSVVGLLVPSVDNPGSRFDKIQENIRTTIYGEHYERLSPNDAEGLQHAQSEIRTWLTSQVELTQYDVPALPNSLRAEHQEVKQDLKYYHGSFYPDLPNQPNLHYYIDAAHQWPDDLPARVGKFAKYYETFRLLRHGDKESVQFMVHPDNTYNLEIRFHGRPDGKINLFNPPALPLSEMPKQELELVKSELQKLQEIKGNLRKSIV